MPLDQYIEGRHGNASRAWKDAQTRCMVVYLQPAANSYRLETE